MKTADELQRRTLKKVKPVRKMSVSEWAEKYFRLPSTSAEPGRYKTARTPYVREIMDAFTQADVHKVAVKSAAQAGKALAIDTPIPTPEGFKAMGELQIGDKVFDERGEICNVIAVSEIFYNHDCYKVTFSDGAEIVADAEHLWQVQEDLKESILTTEEISRNLKNGDRNRYAIPVVKSLKLPQNAPVLTENFQRRIINVEKVASVPTKCIAVNSPNHLYLAGRNFIPTHNSTILLAVIGRFVHLDPTPIMIVQPTLETAMDFSKDRLERMIQDVGVLTPLFYDLGKTRNANQTILSKFFTGGRIVLVGANSPSGDEVDRFPTSAGQEGDPISLAEKRQTSFWNYKTGLFSTPTVENASRIDVEYNLGTQEKWMHKCPNCGEYHFLDYREMAVNYDEKIDEYKKRVVVVNQVKWRCPDCGAEFSELEMKNTAQKYIAENPDALKNGVRSFWVNGFSSTFLSWKRIMQEYLEARGDAVREAVVFNTRFGLSYEHKGEFNDEKVFVNRLEENMAEIPDEVKILTAGVDVQNNRFEVTVFGWGIGESAYGICHEVIRGSTEELKTFEALDNFLAREWHYSNGTALKVARTFIDSGYNTKMIYEYCRRRVDRGIFPIKGTGLIGVPLLYKYNYPKGAGVILTILGVNDGKNIFFGKLAIENAENSGYVHFLKDNEKLRRGFDSEYFRQLIAERRVIRRSGGLMNLTWEPVKVRMRNEALDCAIYAMAAFQSCKGNLSGEEFFRKLTTPVSKKTVRQRNIEVW